MGTTASGLPYPEPTDPIAQGADAIKLLAQAIDPTLTGKVSKAGDTMTGTLVTNVAGSSSGIQLKNASDIPTLVFYKQDGTRLGLIQIGTGSMSLTADAAAGSIIRLMTGTTEVGRFTNTDLLLGKTGTSADIKGCRLSPGSFFSTVDAPSNHNIWLTKVPTANVTGQIFLTMRMPDSATQIGSISNPTNTTSVAFNTTCHGPWKGEITELDAETAIAELLGFRPVSYRWKVDANGKPTETGRPSGPVERGFVAAELAADAPYAAYAGYGTEAEEADWIARMEAAAEAGEEFDEPEPFLPGGADNAKLVPTLVAALQGALARIDDLTDRLAALEAA